MFLANENFPRPSTILLRENGFEVTSVREEYSGITDEQVMQIATGLNLIILTFDSDYGELIFKYAKDNPPAVVFFRDKGNNPVFAALTLISLLEKNKLVLSGAFTVIESNNVRQRFYSTNKT